MPPSIEIVYPEVADPANTIQLEYSAGGTCNLGLVREMTPGDRVQCKVVHPVSPEPYCFEGEIAADLTSWTCQIDLMPSTGDGPDAQLTARLLLASGVVVPPAGPVPIKILGIEEYAKKK